MKNKAFTLIELLVVMAVIAILVLLATPRFLGHTRQATLTQIQHDVKVVEGIANEHMIHDPEIYELWQLGDTDAITVAVTEGRVFSREGISFTPPAGNIRILPTALTKNEAGTRLKGTFYIVEGGAMVYYVNDKVIVEQASLLPEPIESGGVDLAPFIYWQEQAKEAGSEKTVEELLETYISAYYDEEDGEYSIKPGKEDEIQLLEDGMRSMIEGQPFARFTEVETVIRRDLNEPCLINRIYSEYDNVYVMQNPGQRYVVEWWPAMSNGEIRTIKAIAGPHENVFGFSRRQQNTSTNLSIWYGASNNHRIGWTGQSAIFNIDSMYVYGQWDPVDGGIRLRLWDAGRLQIDQVIPTDFIPCSERPAPKVADGSPLKTGAVMIERSNSSIVNYLNSTGMTTQQKIDAINGRSGAGHPHFIFSMIG